MYIYIYYNIYIYIYYNIYIYTYLVYTRYKNVNIYILYITLFLLYILLSFIFLYVLTGFSQQLGILEGGALYIRLQRVMTLLFLRRTVRYAAVIAIILRACV